MGKTDLKDKKVVVMGLGSFGGGADSAAYACRRGARVLVTDMADETKLADTIESLKGYPIEWHLGGHAEDDFRTADILIVNPAVPPDNRYIQLARDAGVLITSQVRLFFENCPARTVAITGSNGKSTTASLTAHLLEAGAARAGLGRVYLSGNIGNRPLLGLLDDLTSRDVVVIEISSFQLEQLSQSKLGPDIALITNLTPNHLDRHGTLDEYARCKRYLFENQTLSEDNPAVSIFNALDPIGLEWYEQFRRDKGRKCVLFHVKHIPDEVEAAFALPGRVNRQNLAAALAVADQFGLKPVDLTDAVASFRGLAHRLELVAETAGIRWYDDSKATTPISTMAALNGIDEPKILIAGGYDKGISFQELGECIARRVKAAVLIGQTAEKIESAVRESKECQATIRRADSMEEAVWICSELAQKGDVVLMSPACASYDMFKNYEQRSLIYKQAVAQITK